MTGTTVGDGVRSREDRARAIAGRVETLPLLPGVVTRLLSLDPESDEYFDNLLAIATSEPSFAVRVLRCANSAASAPARAISSLTQAAYRIGTERCGQLAMAVAVARVFVPRTREQRELWAHSLRVASLSRLIAAASGSRTEICEAAYTAGLVHDIGRFAMFECVTGDFDRIAEAGWDTPQDLLEVEEELLGYDHTRVGQLICEHWALPLPLIEIVRHHHCPGKGSERADCKSPNAATIQLADCVSMHVERHPGSLQASSQARTVALGEAAQKAAAGPDTHMLAWLAEKVPEVERHVELALSGILGLSKPLKRSK
ncbi:MAG: HDOD domain-containing protein [Proteobacteria bacterium]|nr:HDOD domain-containing protein [Pseudomonadota bacterium]